MTHPNLAALEPLIGTWKGEGHGFYPTIEDFDYVEEVTFADVGKPFLVYHQRTWSREGQPMHVEMGYLRAPADGTVELTLALPTGQTELGHGTITADPLTIAIDARVDNTETAKKVTSARRVLRVEGDELVSTYAMEAVGEPLTDHLTSRLQRQA